MFRYESCKQAIYLLAFYVFALATENHIFIIGAFDRFNYGDLLFPLVIEAQLATYGQSFDTRYFGIIESDLSALGGKPTDDIQAFYRACRESTGHTSVIVAGGEAVAVTWSSLLLALNSTFKRTRRFHHYINKVIDLNAFAKRRLHGETALPFVFTASDFAGVDRVIFNSLGGSEIDPATFNRFGALRDKLRGVDYFAVRDEATQRNLAKQGIDTHLYPDSAILMSSFYPVALLAERVSPQVAEYVAGNRHRYVFFQIKNNHAKANERLLAQQLDAVASKTGLHLCLCPIGKALNHDDHLALQRIAPLLAQPSILFDEVTIWDIMYLVANAGVYVGTSLHGAITAMSYAVPYVGIAVTKLHSYLQTWGVDGINHTVSLNEINEGVDRALATDRAVLEQSREQQLNAADASFSHIRQLAFS
ncbi:polysaccharide pyruvyl transferase family protein [Parapedobacter sp. 10938]|uniref:polysaccharide pyruvyl transferase family protein n=1 Tax=Parapedobacter flavus TaxID=3110225 RepID=UPI002DBEEF9D|nr:polysaccharide pyruvyl transferase family protein [Parapedobacter sp. 10938]MEC3879774.1 polysaccharide pyruvyl transferase family protein [Parapedobacter sp. 10938]